MEKLRDVADEPATDGLNAPPPLKWEQRSGPVDHDLAAEKVDTVGAQPMRLRRVTGDATAAQGGSSVTPPARGVISAKKTSSAEAPPTVDAVSSSGSLASGLWTFSSVTPTFNAWVSDPLRRYVGLKLEVEHDPSAAGQGSGLIWSGTSNETSVPMGTRTVEAGIPSGKLQDGWLIRWRVRGYASGNSNLGTPHVDGPWSEWQAGRIDTTKPTVDTVSSSGSLASGLWTFSSVTPTFNAWVSDPLRRYVGLKLEVEHDPSAAGQGSGLIWSGTSNETSVPMENRTVEAGIPSGKLQDGWLIRWRVRGYAAENSALRTPHVDGPWSEWQTGKIDTTKPTVDAVSSSGSLASGLWTFSSVTPTFNAWVSDPLRRYVGLKLEVERDPSAAGQGSGLIWSGTSNETSVPMGTRTVEAGIPSGKLQDGWLIRWRVRGYAAENSALRTPHVDGPWSEWQTGKIEINKPAGSGLGVIPATLGSGAWTLASLTPQFYMKITSSSGAASYLEAEIEHDPTAGQGSGSVWAGKGTTSYPSGSNAWLKVATGKLADGMAIRWRVRGVTTSGVQGTWSEWQLARVDLKKPAVAAPGITPSTAESNFWTLSSLTPWAYAQVTDSEGRPSLLTVEVEHDPAFPAQGAGLIYAGTGTQAANSGSKAWVQIPAAKLRDGWLVRWRVQAKTTSGITGLWSNWQSAKVDLAKPSVEDLGMDPAARGTASWTAGSLTPHMYAKVSDPENRPMRLDIEVEHDPDVAEQGTGRIWAGTTSTDNATSTRAWLAVPADKLKDGWHIRWRAHARTTTGIAGPWSDWVYAKISALPFETFAPAHNTQVDSLTPVLSANARPLNEAPVKYWFQVCEGSAPNWAWCEDSRTWKTSGAWQVPDEKLVWGKTYSWMVKAATTFTTVTSSWRTFTPSPEQGSINGLLTGGTQGREFNHISGNYARSETDASVAVVGPPLSVTRAYNSLDPRTDGIFGAGWTTRWDMRIEVEPQGTLLVTYPSGEQMRFAPKGDGTFAAPSGTFATLATEPGGGWRLMDKSATSYWFDASGRLLKITDNRGRSQELTRDTNGKLTKVTAVGSRSLTFSWTGSHVASVSTDAVDGKTLTWMYTYEGDYLTKVCPPTSATACAIYGYTAASRYKSLVTDSAPEYYYRLNENQTRTGTIVASAAGWNITEEQAKLTGTTPADLGAGVPGALAGSPDTAMRFKGAATSTFVQLPRSAISGQGGEVTVEAWFKTTASGTIIGMQNSADNTPSAFVPVVYVGTDGKLRGQFYTAAHTPITSTAAVNDGNWHHVVLSAAPSKPATSTTGPGSLQTLYLDGAAVGTLAGEIKHGDMWETRIGTGYGSTAWPSTTTSTTAFPFNGDIDEVAIYGKPLSAPAVTRHYAARNAQLQLTKVTWPSGRVGANNTYSPDGGRLVTHTDAHRGSWTLSEPAYAKQTTVSTFATVTVTDPDGGTTTYVNDAQRGYRPVSQTDQVGATTTWAYDVGGYPAKVFDGNGNVVELAYSSRGNLLSQTTCRTREADCSTRYFSYFFDADEPFDPRNDVMLTDRDERSASAIDETYMTSWLPNTYGEQIKQTTPATPDFPNGRVVTLAYTDGSEPAISGGATPAGLVKTKTDPQGNAWTYRYTSAGDLAEQSDPAGLVTKLEYDALGRLITSTQVSSAHPDGVKSIFAYDGQGRLEAQTEPGVKNEITGVTHTRRIAFSYDPDSNKLSETVSDLTGGDAARTTAYTYDAQGRVETVTDPEGGVVRQAWNVLGQLARLTDASGTVIENGYSRRGELILRTLKGWTGSPVNPQPATDVVLESFSYDPAGRLAARMDAMGRKTSYTYYADNLLSEVIGDDVKLNGSATATDVVLEANIYDAAGNLTKKITGGGLTTTDYVYDAANRLTWSILDPAKLARKTAFVYDANGLITKETRTGAGSSREETVENSYNSIGVLIRQKVENGSQDLITTWQVDDRGLITAMTDPRGNADGATPADFTTTHRYDVFGRPVETTVPTVVVERAGVQAVTTKPTTRVGYDTFGNQTHFVDAEGKTSTTSYNKSGRIASQTMPAYTPPGGTTVTPQTAFAYDSGGRLHSVTNTRGHATTYEYDALGNRVRVTDPPAGPGKPAGQWVSEYDLAGEELAVIDPTGARIQATYDDLGRQITHTEIERKPATAAYITRMTYNDAGDLTKTVLPDDKITSYEVNAAGEVMTVTDPMNDTTTYTYDIAGRPAKVTNLIGNATIGEYDLAGRLTDVKRLDSNGAIARTVSFGYDAAGNQIQHTSGEGHTTRRNYDATNMVTKLIEPVSADESITTSFGHDANGARTRVTDGRGNTTWTTYNSLGLIETLTEPATTAHPDQADRTWTHVYDAAGNETALIKPGGVRLDRQFDALDQVTKVTGSGAGIVAEDKTYTYDLSGRPTMVSGQSLEYNDRSLLTKVTSSTSGTSNFSYDAVGNPTQRVDVTGTTTFTWDKDDRLKTVNDPVSGRINTYDYDKADRLTTITSANPANTQTYTYDALDRLLTHTLQSGSGALLAKITYGWDKDDNLTSKATEGLAGAGTNTYGYDHANRLTSWTGPDGNTTNYGWDASGNRIKAGDKTFTYDERNRLISGDGSTYTYSPRGTLAGQTKNGDTRTLTFDAFDRLINDGDATYTYDAFDRMTTRQTGSGKQRFVYAGLDNDVVAITDQNGAIQSSYGRDPVGGLVSVKEGGNPALGALTDLHQDLIGTFSGTALSATSAYSPFGEVVARTGIKPNLGYQSEYTDPDTGAVNMHARWYQPGTGGFASRDTWEFAPDPSILSNRYTYGAGNPLVYTDPSGKAPNPRCYRVVGAPVVGVPVAVACDVLTDAKGTASDDVAKGPCKWSDPRPQCNKPTPKPDPCAEFNNKCHFDKHGTGKKDDNRKKEPTDRKRPRQPSPPNNYHPPAPPAPPSPRPPAKKDKEPVRKPDIPWGNFCGNKCMIDGNLPLDEIWPVGIDYTGFGGVWFLDGDGPGFVKLPTQPTTEPQDDQGPAPVPEPVPEPVPNEEPAPGSPNGGNETSGCTPKNEPYVDPRDERPIGGFARYCRPSDLEGGSPASVDPKYWPSTNPAPNPRKPSVRRYSRCHVVGNQLGGSGTNRNNLVPCLSTVNNGPMKRYENAVKKAVREAAGRRVVDYRVEVKYDGGSTLPSRFRMTTSIDGEVVSDECIHNDSDLTVTDGYYC
ncbi:DNA/RNA non-specific endonuclease [Nonomuraea sp. NPDC052265]|uniref:DNA/RNA non-specific endonuclease n=1 Tax=Nonomuraea sp. NPDC052265 TaxID=3364374 RepID=UPI0037C9D93B